MFFLQEETISSPSRLPKVSTFWKGCGRAVGGDTQGKAGGGGRVD